MSDEQQNQETPNQGTPSPQPPPAQTPPPGTPPPSQGQAGQDGGFSKEQRDKKLVAGILGILLGGFGVHKFYLGYTKEGVIQIVITILTCGIGSILGLVEGILYLVKTDDEFVSTYVVGNKPWF